MGFKIQEVIEKHELNLKNIKTMQKNVWVGHAFFESNW